MNMNNALSRSKSAFFCQPSSSQTSTPSSRFNKPHPPLPNVQNTPGSSPPPSSSLPFTCPTPCALHDHSHHSSTPAAPASSSGTVRSARSVFFESKRIKKVQVALDDDETYCVLSEEGVEILAKSGEEEYDETLINSSKYEHSRSFSKSSSKALKRTPSLSTLLKTPSRLNLRKMPSKMRLFGDTPSSIKSNSTMAESSFSHNIEVPPLPAMIPEYHPVANTPTSNKSTRSSKSFLRRAVFRDKVEKLANKPIVPLHDVSEHPLPGTVAYRVKAMEDTYRRSLIVESDHNRIPSSSMEAVRSASVPLLSRPDEELLPSMLPNAKTPARNKWLDRLHLGKSSTNKRRTRLEIPNFEDSPGLAEKVEKELKHRSREEQPPQELADDVNEAPAKPTLRVQIDAPADQDEVNRASSLYPSPAATPTHEAPHFFDRLSLAVSPHFIGANHNHTFTFGTRLSATSYFGSADQSPSRSGHTQALVASSPLSGDLHISHSPARNGADVVDRLNASFRARELEVGLEEGDVTGRFSIFSYEEKEKITHERPKSDPIPLKNIAHATNELRNLKLLMLTGNRLPRPPPAAPVFASPPKASSQLQLPQAATKLRPSMSPQQGRVSRLKDTWEAKMSPKKDEVRHVASGSSPRYVRPLPGTFENKGEILRPQLLSNLSLNEAIIPPDTPPPSSPSASEMSFASASRSSLEYIRSNGVQGRLASFGRRRGKGHKRQSSQLSKHSVIAEPIQEEVTATITLETIQSESPCSEHVAPALAVEETEQEYSDYTNAYEVLDSYLEEFEDSPPNNASPPPKAISPLIIRKTRSQTSIASERSLHLGLDAFQTKSQQFVKPRKSAARLPAQPILQQEEIRRDPVIIAGEDESHWEALESHSQLKWTRFCHEAIQELQKSRTLFPDTDAVLDIYGSPTASSNSSISSSIYASPLIQAFSTPGSGCAPDLTSPAHQSAIVSFILDSQARYRSENEDGSLDMPSTPELSPDRSDGMVLQANGTSEVNLPSPMHIKRLSYRPNQAKRTSYQPKSLMLVQKHLSNSSTALLSAKKEPAQLEQVEVVPQVRQPTTTRNVLQEKVNEAALPKSKKGFKPRVAPTATAPEPASPKKEKGPVAAVRKAEPIVRPLTPGKRIRAIVKNRNVQVYADEVLTDGNTVTSNPPINAKQAMNAFLPGRKLSQRRNDAFTAAQRKLEGVGSAGEQSDRSSGASSTDETEIHKTGLQQFAARPPLKANPAFAPKGTVLEGGGSVDAEDARTSGVFGLKSRPRPPSRRVGAGLVRSMR